MGNGIEKDLLRKFKNSQKELDAANKEIDELKLHIAEIKESASDDKLREIWHDGFNSEEPRDIDFCDELKNASISVHAPQQSLAHIQSKAILDALKFAIDRYDEGNTLASSIELYANQLKHQAD